MQSLESAARTCVLGALAGAVLMFGCGRPNPGFKLKDTGDSQGESTTQGPISETTETAPLPTTSTTTTTGESMTTAGPAVSGSDSGTTTTMGDPSTTTTTTEGSTTTTPMPMWNDDCGAQAKPFTYELDADTFFTSDVPQGVGCDYGSDVSISINCTKLTFGGSERQRIYDYEPDNLSIFAVRFAPAQIVVEGVPLHPDGIVDVRLELFVERVDQKDTTIALKLLRALDADKWVEGTGAAAQCGPGQSSFDCTQCKADPDSCMTSWSKGDPATAINAVVQPTIKLGNSQPENGPLIIFLPETEVELLKAEHPGFLLVPAMTIEKGALDVLTKENKEGEAMQYAPRLIVHYCPPEFG